MPWSRAPSARRRGGLPAVRAPGSRLSKQRSAALNDSGIAEYAAERLGFRRDAPESRKTSARPSGGFFLHTRSLRAAVCAAAASGKERVTRSAAAGTMMMRTGEAASCPPCVAYPHGADGRGVPHTYGAHCGRCSAACPSRVNSHITSSPRIVFEGGALDGNVHIRTERTLQRVGDVRRRGNSHMPAASTRRQCRDPCGHQPFPMPTALTAPPRRGATSGAPASVPLARVAFAWRWPQRRPGPAVRVRRFPGTESAGP